MGQKKRKIFRKVALEKLSSPEQLDALIQVVNPAGWLALVAFGALTIALLAWSILGSVSYKIAGQGMMINQGGIYDIYALSSGQIAKLEIKLGDVVAKGEVIARIDQPDAEKRITNLKAELTELQRSHSQLSELGEKGYDLQKQFLTQRRKSIEAAVARSMKQKKFFSEKLENQRALLEEGLITKNTLLDTQQQYYAFLEEYNSKKNELDEISAKLAGLDKGLEEQAVNVDHEINNLKRDLEQMTEQLRLTSNVIAAREGRIIELKVREGDYVKQGISIATAEAIDDDPSSLKAVIYVPVYDGKKIKPGMEIQIEPAVVKKEEHGIILGKVKTVSDFPATHQSMMQVLRNEKLVETLSLQGAPYEIKGDLLLDLRTPSAYKWSTKRGFPGQIRSGTFCRVTITIQKKAPIEFLLPYLSKALGS